MHYLSEISEEKFSTLIKAFFLFFCCKAQSVPNNLPCHNAVSKKQKEKDFIIGNVISTSISLRGIRQITEIGLGRNMGQPPLLSVMSMQPASATLSVSDR